MNRLLTLIAALALITPLWTWPVGGPTAIIGAWSAPEHRYASGHRGIDIDAANGSPVASPASGTVHFAGTVVDRAIVTVRTDDGVLASLEPVTPAVAEGDRVVAGQMVGTVGAGGHCSERCVHLGVRVDGDYVSPLRFLGGLERAVLLPMN
ncbi:M23 family metallopeptidase [Microbacteriaceae bacterium VKM Ac-2855]|nr:M23 family metallopeptidase [Microbacteriaceae bacterium VKM Ac-2855]